MPCAYIKHFYNLKKVLFYATNNCSAKMSRKINFSVYFLASAFYKHHLFFFFFLKEQPRGCNARLHIPPSRRAICSFFPISHIL